MQPLRVTNRKTNGVKTLEKERDYVSADLGPSGFHWLVNGLLGGTRRPGVFKETRYDIEALQHINVSLLITLNQNWQPPVKELAAHGIDSLVHKITDLHAPDFDQAFETCAYVHSYLADDRVCVYHCRAGRGRTGTMLAAQLMYFGYSAGDAISETRGKNPSWIENDVQLAFLHAFGGFLAEK